VTRSVERLDGVKKAELDLNTGRGTVTLDKEHKLTGKMIWDAIVKSGFTPVRVELDGQVYTGGNG